MTDFSPTQNYFVCIYLLPDTVRSSSTTIIDHVVMTFDYLLSIFPAFNVILCGDFNRLNCEDIFVNLNCNNIINTATRSNALLDLVIVSNDINDAYNVRTGPPMTNNSVDGKSSDHLTIHCA